MKISLRTRNRIREHADHSWVIIPMESKYKPDEHLFDCTCGWTGWLPKNEIEEAKRLGLM